MKANAKYLVYVDTTAELVDKLMTRQIDFFVQGVHWQNLVNKCVFSWIGGKRK